jgi:hypothetical protein
LALKAPTVPLFRQPTKRGATVAAFAIGRYFYPGPFFE